MIPLLTSPRPGLGYVAKIPAVARVRSGSATLIPPGKKILFTFDGFCKAPLDFNFLKKRRVSFYIYCLKIEKKSALVQLLHFPRHKNL